MNAYSEDLRKKIVEALHRGAGKSQAAPAFGISLSSVKRYAKLDDEDRSLAPKKRPGSRPKMDDNAEKLLEADLEERPSATLGERRGFLELVTGVRVSEATVCRALKRLGWSRKKIGGSERARTRVLEGGLEGTGRRADRREAPGVRGRDGLEHGAIGVLRVGSSGRASFLRQGAAQPREEHDAAGQHERRGDGVVPGAVVGGTTGGALFESYVERVLSPTLSSGQVMVMDNLAAHKGEGVRELIEDAFSKVKGLLRKAGARTREALIEAIGRALDAVTAQDARSFFKHSGYRRVAQLL